MSDRRFAPAAVVQPIEDRLRGDINLALAEGGRYFERQGSVWTTCRRITNLLSAESLPYAVTGVLALFHHGYRRYSENVNLLVTAAGHEFARSCPGFGVKQSHVRTLLDEQTGVSVRFALAGELVDGDKTRIEFPHPSSVNEIEDGVQFANLPTLVTLMLTEGLRARELSRAFADIQELIKMAYLTESLAADLHPEVRDSYLSMCRAIDAGSGPFLRLIAMPPGVKPARTISEIIPANSEDAMVLGGMQNDGVDIYPARPAYEEFVVLVSYDRFVARKYEMHHESEYFFRD